METLTKRQQARDEAFLLIFERGYHPDATPEEIYDAACEAREVAPDPYIRKTFLGAMEHIDEINEKIDKYAVGWKRNRISGVSLAAMTLCIYEMCYTPEVPLRVALNEALLICRRYDDEKMRPFVNGVLNAVMQEILPTRNEK